MANLKPQNETILQHLKHEGSITPLIARGVYNIECLSKRISELRLDFGYKINKTLKKDARGKRYMEYWMDLCDAG